MLGRRTPERFEKKEPQLEGFGTYNNAAPYISWWWWWCAEHLQIRWSSKVSISPEEKAQTIHTYTKWRCLFSLQQI